MVKRDFVRKMLEVVSVLAFCAGLYLTQTQPEISTRDGSPVFQSKLTLIEVPVGTHRLEDFELFDRGKLQVISKFSIQKSTSKVIALHSAQESGLTGGRNLVVPDHFIGIAFEDVDTSFADLSISRSAAQKFIHSGLTAADRVAVFTTTGQSGLDFTDDRCAAGNLRKHWSVRMAIGWPQRPWWTRKRDW